MRCGMGGLHLLEVTTFLSLNVCIFMSSTLLHRVAVETALHYSTFIVLYFIVFVRAYIRLMLCQY